MEAPNRARFPYSHSLFIDDDIKVLIDTSCGENHIQHYLNQGVDLIINTHFHEDHILNNYRFHWSEIWAHPLDAPGIQSLSSFLDMYGFYQFHASAIGNDFVESIQLKESPVDRFIEDGQILDFGTTKIQVIHTPGHTPGHCCFYFEQEDLLFSADIDLSSFGPWYGHLCSSLKDFIHSIKRCMELHPRYVLSSHKGWIEDDIEQRFRNYLQIIYKKQELLLKSLHIPLNLDQIAALGIFYGPLKDPSPLYLLMERMAMYIHLQYLMDLHQVDCAEGVYFLR